MAELVGIGDAHFDKLDSLIPGVSGLITRCWRRVLKYALENGIQHVVFYGDIGDKPRLSDEAICQVIDTIFRDEYAELIFHFILGNHDFAEDGSYSLRWLEILAKRLNRNVRVYSKPEVVKIDGVRFQMLPHPFKETLKEMWNVIHHEVKGSTRDNGRAIDEGPSNKHHCLAGHLHTPHRVRNTFFGGTLYQTNFGEAMPKFFHHARIESTKDYDIQQVPFKPPWEMNNLVVASASDLKQIRAETNILYKLFVKDGADIDLNQVLTKYPNVVRHNSFKSKTDLQQQIEETWEFDADLVGEDNVNVIDEDAVVRERLSAIGMKPVQVKRGIEIIMNMKGKR